MILLLLFILLLLGGLVACEGVLPRKTVSKEIAPTTSLQKTVYPAGMPSVYDQFDDLAFLFKQQSDTTYLINFWATGKQKEMLETILRNSWTSL